MSPASQEHRLLIDLCLQHLASFLWQGPGALLISKGGLPAILADLSKRDVPVIGLEGFEIDGDEVRPRLDLIFDADRVPGFPTPQEVIESWPANIWVDVTLGTVP